MSLISTILSPESESKLYQAESIKISQLGTAIPAVLRHFQGRHAIFEYFSCDISKFIEFVNRWKSGEAYQNLEYLKIRIVSHDVRQDEILNAIEAKHIDAQKTPLTHPLPRRYTEYTKQPNTDPIINHSYVVRESDNRVASFLIAKFWSVG